MSNLSRCVLVFCAVVAFTALGIVLYATPGVQEPVRQEAPAISATIAVDGVLPKETRALAIGTSALQLLIASADEKNLEIRTKEYPGMGTLVEKIGSAENGADGKYWMYYVNGVFAPIGADAYVIQPGDILEWKFEVPKAE